VDDENYIDIVQVENGTQTDETLMDGGCKNHEKCFCLFMGVPFVKNDFLFGG
jgi:hypothetical protein